MEKNTFSKLSELQGKARLVNQARIVGVKNDVTTLWKLDDGSTIIIKGENGHYRGKPASKVQEISKTNQPFEDLVREVKELVDRDEAKCGVQLCF